MNGIKIRFKDREVVIPFDEFSTTVILEEMDGNIRLNISGSDFKNNIGYRWINMQLGYEDEITISVEEVDGYSSASTSNSPYEQSEEDVALQNQENLKRYYELKDFLGMMD